jgi:hypothetical protein
MDFVCLVVVVVAHRELDGAIATVVGCAEPGVDDGEEAYVCMTKAVSKETQPCFGW